MKRLSVLPLSVIALYLPQTQTAAASEITKIVLLGTGTPITDPDRSGPATAIIVNDTPYLVDFGPGLVRRADAAFRAGVMGLKVSKLTRAFVTHLHSDHTAGYPDLIFTPWVMGRDVPLQVYGPKGIKEMTRHILAAYQQDIDMRLGGLQPIEHGELGYTVKAVEIEPGVIYQDSNVTVEAFPVRHGTWSQAFGYKFVTPDRTIVISGDTRPSESIVKACNGCDVLIHEVYSKAALEIREVGWQNYHSKSHTSTHELAELATRARPGLLILYHQLYWSATDEELLAEIRKVYKGKVVSGKDLDIF